MALLDRNILYLEGDVEGEMVNQVHQSLMILDGRGSPPIEIRIYTNGGDVHAGLAVYDFLRRYEGKKTAVVYGYARSMGAIILQACEERVCLAHSTVLIHHVNAQEVSLDDLEDEDRLNRLRDSMRQDQETLYEILVERTERTKEEVRDACKKDKDMTAMEALDFGLIDQIWIPRPAGE